MDVWKAVFWVLISTSSEKYHVAAWHYLFCLGFSYVGPEIKCSRCASLALKCRTPGDQGRTALLIASVVLWSWHLLVHLSLLCKVFLIPFHVLFFPQVGFSFYERQEKLGESIWKSMAFNNSVRNKNTHVEKENKICLRLSHSLDVLKRKFRIIFVKG